MTFYPFYKQLCAASANVSHGNFGLWYNKLIPLKSMVDPRPSDDQADENRVVDYYLEKYKSMKSTALELLKAKHREQHNFCRILEQRKYDFIEIRACLKSPLITGIGESHPHEVSMVFDHNMGIPYIPSSGIKGIVRFAHTLSAIPKAVQTDRIDDNGYFQDEDEWTSIPIMFGTQKKRGRIIFLDAYPEKVPDLHVDIMNPHYGPYYGDEKQPPADYYQPNPIKFLTVNEGAVFVFRAIAQKNNGLSDKVEKAFRNALTDEGIGAKTAVGYGRFEIIYNEKKETGKSTGIGAADPEFQKKTDVNTPVVAVKETWENAYLSWSPGNQVLTAILDNRKATVPGKALVPTILHKTLFEKRKGVRANVTIERIGTGYKIIGIEVMR